MLDNQHILGSLPYEFENGVKVRINAASMNRFLGDRMLQKFPSMQYFNREDGKSWQQAEELPNRYLPGFGGKKSRSSQVMGALTQ